MKKNHLIAAIIAGTAVLLAPAAEAWSDSRIIIKPMIMASLRHDSNFYRDPVVEKDLTTYMVQPGLTLGIESAKAIVELIYSFDATFYNDRTEDDFNGHSASLMVGYDPSERLRLTLEDTFYLTRDPAELDAFNNSVDRREYSINRIAPTLFYDFQGRFSVKLGYRNSRTDYSQALAEDSVENRGIADLIYHLNSSSVLDLEYQYWQADYDLASTDYAASQVMLLFRKEWSKFDLELGGGYQDRSFDGAGVADIERVTWRLAVNGKTAKSRLTAAVSSSFNDQGAGDLYYKADQVSIKAEYLVLEKLRFGANLVYQRSDYEASTRQDDTWSFEGSLKYPVTDWLALSLAAGYERRDSSQAVNEYDNAYYLARLIFEYDRDRGKGKD